MIDLHLVDARAARALANASLEPFDGLRLAFRGDFDAAVGKVAHPPVYAFTNRRRLDEETEADALDASADQISTREAHADALTAEGQVEDPSVRLYFSATWRKNPPAATTERLRREWATWGGKVKPIVLASPFRSMMEPLLEYIEQVENERPDDYLTVILPEFVPARWRQHLLQIVNGH
jgi:hypothetical protein